LRMSRRKAVPGLGRGRAEGPERPELVRASLADQSSKLRGAALPEFVVVRMPVRTSPGKRRGKSSAAPSGLAHCGVARRGERVQFAKA
jgi:hypothetical protein